MKPTFILFLLVAVVAVGLAAEHRAVAGREIAEDSVKANDESEAFLNHLRNRHIRNKRQPACYPSGGPECEIGSCGTCCLDCNGNCAPDSSYC